jgi:hypothetical protein
MENWQVVAYVEVSALQARYVQIIDGRRSAELPTLFTPEGTLESKITGRETRRENLSAYLEAVFATRVGDVWSNIRHFITPPDVTFVDQAHVSATCYFAAYNAEGIDHWGVYSDQVERQGESWLFAQRAVDLFGAAPGSWVGSGSAGLSS